MNTRTIRSALISTLGVALALASGSVFAQTTYRLTDLGTLGGTLSDGRAINDAGQVTGTALTDSSDTAGNAIRHAFLWDGTTMKDLGTLGGSYSNANAINDSGSVTGQAWITGNTGSHAVVWNDTTVQDLGTLGANYGEGWAINASGQVTGGSFAAVNVQRAFLWNGTMLQDLGTLGGTTSLGLAINDSAQVTGFAQMAGDATFHAFLWNGTALQDLGTLGGTHSYGSAINASGQVTGWAHTGADRVSAHAFLWNGSLLQDLGTLGGSVSNGYAINASGQVTGYSYIAGNVSQHAFLWDGTRMRDLGSLGGTLSYGLAVNNAGQVTGGALTTGDAATRAFLWDGGSALQDLNALIDPADPLQPHVTLVEGRDINERGQIVANGFDSRTGEQHAYLVSPVEAGISLAIEKHAGLTEQGAVVIRVHIVCGPFAGVEDFQEASAGASQKTGAEAEGGLDGTVVCDGVERTHTAHLSSSTGVGFKRGPAGASVSLSVCMLVGDEQTCFQDSTQRSVVIGGRLVP